MSFKKLIVLVILAIGSSFVLSLAGVASNKAHAAVLGWDDAVNYVNDQCNAGRTMAHAGYGYNGSVNLANGVVTYDFAVIWRKCNSWSSTSEYAVTGYANQACPTAGRYHNGGWEETYDCIKYSSRHTDQWWGDSSGNIGRECAWNPYQSARCVYNGFNSSVLQGPRSGPGDTAFHARFIATRKAQIGNWGVVGQMSGKDQVYVATICAYDGAPGSNLSPCMDSYVPVSWEVFNYTLTPSVSGVTDGKVESPSSVPYSVIGAVGNSGPTPSRDTDWQLTRVVYDGAPPAAKKAGNTSSNQDPCKFVGNGPVCTSFQSGKRTFPKGGTDAYSGTDTTGNLTTGKQVCYFMSVKPRSSKSGDWYHSPMKCIIIAKSPKINLLGGDLSVIGSGATVISTSLTTNLTAGRPTTYGSWAEYGVLASAGVRNFASGAGLARGVGGGVSNICPAQSQLTFANNETTGCALGGYDTTPVSNRLQNRFKPYTATLAAGKTIDFSQGAPANPSYIGKNAIYGGVAAGKITITGGALGKGEWVVINAPNMDVEINGDVTYFGGTLNALKDIPQLVIIAKNINISESVGRVDAWLVAAGTGTEGNLSTCYQIPKSVMGTTATGTMTAAHSASRCGTQLTVNGPVIANHLYLYRTAGAGTEKAAGDPAERFNYRPDAYLWSLGYSSGGSGVPTVTTTELPPRF